MAKKSFLQWVADQRRALPPVANADLNGKTVLIVGANTGLGFEAAKHFARMGAGRLILACRSKDRGEAAIQRLKEETGYSAAELRILDLADFASVKAFVDQAENDLERLDILLLNAGICLSPDEMYSPTSDGWEKALEVNSISTHLLALLLLPRMLDTAKQFDTIPRLVIVSSETHYWASFEDKVFESPNAFELLNNKEYCTPRIMRLRYLHTKLLNVFFTRALSRHLKNKSLIVNTVNPGLCNTELTRGGPGIVLGLITWLIGRPAEEGSRQLVWAAIGVPEGNGHSLENLRGAYIHHSHVDEPSDFVIGEEGKKREDKLWIDLISILEKVDPRIRDIVRLTD